MRSDSFQGERDLIEDLPEYRPVNGLLIIAGLLLAPSVLGVFHPAFLAFSVLAMVLAAWSILRNAGGRGRIPSRGAWIVLALAVAMNCLQISIHYSQQRREYSFVVGSVERWLELLRGENPQEAYFLTLEPGFRPDAPGEDVGQPDSNNRMIGVVETEEQFMAIPGVVAFANPRNTVTYVALAKRPASFLRKEYWLTFRLHIPDRVPPDVLGIIEFRQLPDLGGPIHWQVGACRLIE